MSTDVIRDTDENRAQNDLVTGAVGSRCANCQAPMASDQRYCLTCGERRGKPRFGAALTPATPADAAASTAGPGERYPRSRTSSAATLVAGVATLLIALGVGVLIGHDSNSTPQRSGFQVVTVNGGSGTTSASSPGQSTQASPTRSAAKHPKVVVVHLTPKLQQKAANAATKVFGSSGGLSKNVTQKVNGSCSGGAGCQNGKFTGNFFSGG